MPDSGGFDLTERHETTRSGERVLICPVRPQDMALYPDFLAEVSADDLRLRFFARAAELSAEESEKLTHLDVRHEMAFVALDDHTGRLLGLVRLKDELDEEDRGIRGPGALPTEGSRARLAADAAGHRLCKKKGLRRVYGDVLRENAAMLQMCAELDSVRTTGDASRASCSISGSRSSPH